jgi:hypothetical protein
MFDKPSPAAPVWKYVVTKKSFETARQLHNELTMKNSSMALSLKRKEGLRKGLHRITEKCLEDILKATSHNALTAKPVHEIRKAIKSLRAILRLTRGRVASRSTPGP